MSLSIRDQLLKAGLVSEKQVQNAERQQKREQFQQPRGRKKPTGPSPQQLAIQKAQAEKAVRDAELNRKKQEKVDRKAKFAEVKQLVEQNQVPRVETDEFYNFVDGTKIRRVSVTAEHRDRLIRGELAIVRIEGRYAFVPAAAAAEIRARVERAVIHHNTPKADDAGDDPYKDFVVPDDLMW